MMARREKIRLRPAAYRTKGVRRRLLRAPAGKRKKERGENRRDADVWAVDDLEDRTRAALGEARSAFRSRKESHRSRNDARGEDSPEPKTAQSARGRAEKEERASGSNRARTEKRDKQITYRSRNRATSENSGGRMQASLRTRARDTAVSSLPDARPIPEKAPQAGRPARRKPGQSRFRQVKHSAQVRRTKAHALSRRTAKKATAAAAKKTRLSSRVKQVADKLASRTLAVVGKALLSMLKGMMTFLLGFSSPMLVLVACAGAVVAAISSPLGILFTGDGGITGISLSTAMAQADYEYTHAQDEAIAAFGADRVIYNYVGSDDGVRIENWPDVLAVYAVKTNMPTDGSEGVDVLEFNVFKIIKLAETYAEMNPYTFDVSESEVDTGETDETGDPVTATVRTLTVNVYALSRFDAYTLYSFDQERMDIAEELYGEEEFRNLVVELRGEDLGLPVTDEDLEKIFGKLPDNAVGSDVVKTAFTRLGYPYSKMDCSDFTGWAYAQNGVRISSYAAGQAKECYDNGWVVAVAELQPGDLVFFSSGKDNGRFMRIDHVGIYVGGGMIIDSSSSNGKVVYRKMWKSVLCGRPCLGED